MSEPTTSHDELDTKIMRSSAFAIVGFGGTNVLSLVTTIVLARLLTPADFGLVALTVSLLAFTHLVQESGLGAALVVHRGDLKRAAASAALFTPVVGLGLYVVCFAAAPVFANLFREPELTNVFRVAALILPLRGLAIVPLALLEREMRFGRITTIELAGGIAQTVVAISFAVAGAGVWSLVAGQLATGVVQLVVAWRLIPLRFSIRDGDRKTLRELMRYGRHVGLANVIDYGNASAEGIVVGRVLGAISLGYFSIAKRLASMPVEVLGNILGRGVFAAFARLHDDIDGSRRVWLANIQRLALVVMPATIGLVVVAEPLVLAILGEKWRPAVVPLQILALNCFVRVFSTTAGEAFQAQNRPKFRVYASTFHLVLIVPLLVLGSRWHGVNGAAAAVVCTNVLVGIPVIAVVMRMFRVTVAELLGSLLRPAIGWIAMTVALLAVRPVVADLAPALELAALVLVGAAVYGAAVALFAREIVVTMWSSLRGTRVPG